MHTQNQPGNNQIQSTIDQPYTKISESSHMDAREIKQ